MRFYVCHVTREKGYKPFALDRPPRPARPGDMPGCVNYKEKQDGRCRVTGKACDGAEAAEGETITAALTAAVIAVAEREDSHD